MTGTVRGETPVRCSGISAALRVASMQRASARMVAGVPTKHAHDLGEIELGG